VISQKTKMLTATIFAVLSALLRAEAAFTLFPPEKTSMPIAQPQTNPVSQLVWSLGWLCFAVAVSLLIVGAALLVKRVFSPKTKQEPQANEP
jgi:hypothetical protein